MSVRSALPRVRLRRSVRRRRVRRGSGVRERTMRRLVRLLAGEHRMSRGRSLRSIHAGCTLCGAGVPRRDVSRGRALRGREMQRRLRRRRVPARARVQAGRDGRRSDARRVRRSVRAGSVRASPRVRLAHGNMPRAVVPGRRAHAGERRAARGRALRGRSRRGVHRERAGTRVVDGGDRVLAVVCDAHGETRAPAPPSLARSISSPTRRTRSRRAHCARGGACPSDRPRAPSRRRARPSPS
ncbi:MAG: hypothetical protein JWP87_2944 [Labilithrix sp.]|nr:hypothetical protein [Labilithrix sp.]